MFLAVTAGLLLERPLPALPFIAIGFVLANVDLSSSPLSREGPDEQTGSIRDPVRLRYLQRSNPADSMRYESGEVT
jgi:hypothetical protein